MSLVTYDLSDSEEECEDDLSSNTKNISISENKSSPLHSNEVNNEYDSPKSESISKTMFNILPKPKDFNIIEENIKEDDVSYVNELSNLKVVNIKPVKEKTRAQILIPSLSEFKDVEDKKAKTMQPSQKQSSLLSMLPPPKSQSSKIFVPQILKKNPSKPQPVKKSVKENNKKIPEIPIPSKIPTLLGTNYDSESEDEEETCKSTPQSNKKLDYFSLTSSKEELSNKDLATIQKETEEMTAEYLLKRKNNSNTNEKQEIYVNQYKNEEVIQPNSSSCTSSFDLHKEDIIMKNKVEVGPKLPVPEQDYNLDSKGNVAFDDKAIQYLCGKRGMKRKNEELESANIIEINGEDIKPDEREWLVKALTENPIHRPVSLGTGPGGQFKKKHQITYLAHQAKAMELELQNQWSQNRMTRQQTQSKYGF